MKKIIFFLLIGGAIAFSCKKEDDPKPVDEPTQEDSTITTPIGDTTITVPGVENPVDEEEPTEEEPTTPTYENFYTVNGNTITPNGGNWVQAGYFGYDEATSRKEINQANFEYHYLSFRVSSQFDYYDEVGKTYTLTTTSENSDMPVGEVYVEYRDQTGGLTKRLDYPALAGQTIKMTVISTHTTGIVAYFEVENLNLEDNKTLTAKVKI